MTTLTEKLEALRTEPTDSVRETNTLLSAIKGDGPDSLVDLNSALNLNTSTLIDIRTLLENLAALVETMNNNASTNAQQTISAVINSSCGCDTVAPDNPFPSDPLGFDCQEAILIPSLTPQSQSAFYTYNVPARSYQFGPPRTFGEDEVYFEASEEANPSNQILLTLDQCPYTGEINPGNWLCRILNESNNNVGSQPVGACFTTGSAPLSDKCARAQAVTAGFIAIMAAFSRMSDGTVLTNSAINLAWSYGSAYIEARPPDSLTRQNLINLYLGAQPFHYGFIPSGFDGPTQEALIDAIYSAGDAEGAGVAFLDVIETQSGLDAPYLDFVKSIPQQFWFNAAFDETSTALNTTPFDNGACEPA